MSLQPSPLKRLTDTLPVTHPKRLLLALSWAATLLTLALTVLSSTLPLFDSSPHALIKSTNHHSSLRRALSSAVLRWDAFHFAHIAKHGYVHEHEWAFFPGVPWLMRRAALILHWLDGEGPLYEWEDLLLGGLVTSAVSIPSVITLYELTVLQFRSRPIAFLASLLSLLPSSPVTLRTAGYSEPFFTFLSYQGMLYCARKQWLLAACCFSLATTFRSTGIFLSGFIAWGLVVEPFLENRKFHLGRVLYGAVLCASTLAFFIYHQYRAYRLFCAGTAAPALWCHAVPPSIYAYVQTRYWNVGFLRYWTLQQLPNFLLGAPPLALLFSFTLHYSRLALVPRLTALFHTSSTLLPAEPREAPFLAASIAPHVIHALFLSCLLLFASHTQIVLRQAASMPLIYWAAAWLVVEKPALGRLWIGWSVIWGAVSCVLWGVFLPPA